MAENKQLDGSGQHALNAAIAACAQRFAESRSIDEVLKDAVTIIRDVIGLDRAGIFLYDDQACVWHGVYGTDVDGSLRDEHALVMPADLRHPIHRVQRNEGDEFFYEDFAATFCDDPFMGGVENCFFIALKAHDRLLGGISVDNLETGRPVDDQVCEEMRRFARYIALALENLELTKQLQKSNAQLERANRDLVEFADVVSHDLTSPLQMVTLSVELVLKKYEATLNDDVKDRLAGALQNSLNMGRLLHGILNYSRTGNRQANPVLIEVDILLHNVLEMMTVPPGIDILLPNELPHLIYDQAQLHQVFQNLIGNAVKYMGDSHGTIEVTCQELADSFVFSVKDNGVGIEPDKRDCIFKMFDRAGQADDGVSSGIGLALVKKIVERNGGTVTVESEVGKGSIFSFSVPKIRFAKT